MKYVQFLIFNFQFLIMQVLKFGGSSVANAKNINSVIAIVQESLKNDNIIVIFFRLLEELRMPCLRLHDLLQNHIFL